MKRRERFARTILDGFESYFDEFQTITLFARARFETADWTGLHGASTERIDLYKAKIRSVLLEVESVAEEELRNYGFWRDVRRLYAGMIRGFLLKDEFKPMIPHWTARQAYIALGNLMTSAALLGIDTCPMEGLDPAAFSEALGLEEQGYAAVVGCALGYRAADDKYASLAKVRYDKSKLVQHV